MVAELGRKIRYESIPEGKTFRTQPRATETSIPQEVPKEIQQEIPQENFEKHIEDRTKVITPERVSMHPENLVDAQNPGEQTFPTHPKPTT